MLPAGIAGRRPTGLLPPLALFRLLLTALLLSTTASPAQTTIHVPADQPTIQAGINAAQNGDTVLVAPGTYNENIDFKGKGITVTSGAKSYMDAATTIINGSTSGPVVKLISGEPATAVLNGFTIQGGFAYDNHTDYDSAVTIYASSPTVSNNVIRKNMACGILVTQQASPMISGNDIRENYPPENYSPYAFTCAEPLGGYASPGTALVVVHAGTVTVSSNIIEQNTVYNSTGSSAGGSTVNGSGIYLAEDTKVVLENNIVRDNAGEGQNGLQAYVVGQTIMIQNLFYTDQNAPAHADSGVEVSGNVGGSIQTSLVEVNNTLIPGQVLSGQYASGSILKNNIFGSLVCVTNVSPLPIEYNDISPAALSPNEVPCPLGFGNVSASPQFLSPATGDFHTQRTSPVVAAGDINAPMIPAEDLDSRNRTVCGTIDMGVYEVHPQPPIKVTSSQNPSVGGTAVTFTANLTGNCNVPTGAITFYDGAMPIGTQALSAGATASLTTSALTVGSHNITTSYPGDFNFDSSTSPTLTQTVTGFPTTLTCTASPNPAFSIGFIASATAQSAFGTPTGIVTFTISGTSSQVTVQTRPLLNGFTNILLANPGPGNYIVTGTYSGDTRFAPSTCTLSETGVGTASNTTLGASPNPASLGQIVTFTAGVIAAGNSNTAPAGTIVFTEGSATLASFPVNAAGSAAFSTSTLSVGSHTVIASYSGDKTYSPSTASVTETILLTGTATTLTAAPNPAAPGQAVTLTATVTPTNPTAVAGTVTFLDNGSPLGTATVSTNGTATFTTSTLAIGSHPITATFAAGNSLGGSTSTAITEQIIAPTFTLTLQPAQLALSSGSSGTVQVQLAAMGGYTGTLALRTGALPDYVTASFQPSTVTLPAGGAVSSTLILNTPAITAQRRASPSGNGGVPLAALAAALFLGPFGWRRRRFAARAAILCFALLALGSSGCTDVRYAIHTVQPGTYLIPVTAADANGNMQTATLQLIIKP